MINPLLPSSCHRCGYKGESKLSHAGPHIKQSCGSCGGYIRFIPLRLIPDIQPIKMAIMTLAGGDLTAIAEAKIKVNWTKERDPSAEKVQYWKLILHFIKERDAKKQEKLL